jgi:hypothetical protein
VGAVCGTVVRVGVWGGGRVSVWVGVGVPGRVKIIILVGTGVNVRGEINVPAGAGTRVPVGVEIEGWVRVQCGVMAVNLFVNPDVDVTFSIPN